ncbi:MAG: type IV secretory system conjugative DNA transfer family protein [Patescibacteria group bacterium]|nr:type IV secretory system conjugative DNA transfer family protein [Patescibacteria group bacterium]
MPGFNPNKGIDTKAAKLSPEAQLTKLREQARSGGSGGGGWRPAAVPVEPSLQPTALKTIREATEPRTGIVLELTPDANDKDMEELLGILHARGFDAAMKELERIGNPHLEDDFHRLLIQYKKEGHPIPGLRPDDPLAKVLEFVLLEIAVPETPLDKGGSVKEIIQKMEQLYLSLIPFVTLPDKIFFPDYHMRKLIHHDHFTMELAVSHVGEQAVFYIAVPRSRRDTFEKQIFAVFPRARIMEKKDDNNIFNQFGATAIAYGTYKRPAVYAIKTSDSFLYDPLNVTLAALSKISNEGEGAAIQISVAPAGEYHSKRMWAVLGDLQKGKKKTSDVMYEHRYKKHEHKAWHLMSHFGKSVVSGATGGGGGHGKEEAKNTDSMAIEAVTKKLKSVVVGVNIRIVASARTKERAEHILNELEATFGQYDEPSGNRFKFKRPHGKQETQNLLRSYIFRTFDRDSREAFLPEVMKEFTGVKVKAPLSDGSPVMPMNVHELATLFHIAIAGGTPSREAKTASAKTSPAPPGLPDRGIQLGVNRYSNIETPVHFTPDDRLRHLYAIGQTGTGKTNFLKQMIIQDIENGEGVCFIDPHGVDVLEILSRIPKERYDDLIYFDPAYTQRPMGLNMLEYDPRYPEQKTFVVDEMFKIFQKLYGAVPEAFGPIFEQYFRNATLLVLEDPDTGSTLMDISRVLADDDFRALKLSRSRNPVVNHFWEDIAENVRGEGDLRNVVPYITSKFDIFIANEIMRPIVGQQRSSFDFKDIMDNKKILLVNLSKGRLGDVNANLLGLVIVGKIMMTALARTDYLHTNPPNFYLYIDEFQNITTNTIATILSEARKFRLSMTMAHQFIKQLEEKIRDAVFGNVGTMAVFRVGSDDAEYLAKQYQPIFEISDFLKLDNYRAYLKLLAGGRPAPPFSLDTLAFHQGDFANIEALKQLSYQRYGRERDSIEEEIRTKYDQMRESQK